jgi:hypothetical protein
VEPRRQARKYVTGLIGDLPRKNCWVLAEQAGDATPDKMQRLLERAVWDAAEAMTALRGFVGTQYQRECAAQYPYPAHPASSDRLTVSREAPQGTGVASISRTWSCHDGAWRAR